jgi:hypothetical protein
MRPRDEPNVDMQRIRAVTPLFQYFAVLHAPRSVPHLLKLCFAILAKMGAIPTFQIAAALLAQTAKDVATLKSAEEATHGGPVDAVADRNVALRVVRADMRQLKAVVQSQADADLEHAQAIIASSGMAVGKRPIRTKPFLAARYGKAPTEVELDAKAPKRRASYQWQMSTNQTTWIDLAGTVTASTTVTGLTPATIYYFRFRTLTVAGLSDWSPAISIIAH